MAAVVAVLASSNLPGAETDHQSRPVERRVVSYAFVEELLASDQVSARMAKERRLFHGKPMLFTLTRPVLPSPLPRLDYYRNTGQTMEIVGGFPDDYSPVRSVEVFPVVVVPEGNVGTIYDELLTNRLRRELYQRLIHLAAVLESMEVMRDDLQLVTISLTALEQKYGLRTGSHIDLMALQNTRTIQESQLLIHSNRVDLLRSQLVGIVGPVEGMEQVLPVLPRHILLASTKLLGKSDYLDSSPILRLLQKSDLVGNSDYAGELDDGDRGIDGSSTVDANGTDSVEDSDIRKRRPSSPMISKRDLKSLGRERLESTFMEVLFLINSAAIRYSAYADEIQLRDQEAVATTMVGLEVGRTDFVTVNVQRRKLLADRIEMIRLRSIQHELLANLVYWSGGRSLSELVNRMGTGNLGKVGGQ